MSGLLIGVLLASLAGSLHCAGMCGPLVAVYAGSGARLAAHGAWAGARLGAYATLGAAGGLLGGAADLAGVAAGLGPLAAVLASTTLVLAGLGLLAERAGARFSRVASRGPSVLSRLLARLRQQPPLARAALLGACSALLPCGWLWAFVIVAAGTGDALRGALVMATLWAGTLPVLLGIGVGIARAAPSLRRRLPLVAAVTLLAVGSAGIARRASPLALDAGRALRTAVVGSAATPAPPAPACCHEHE